MIQIDQIQIANAQTHIPPSQVDNGSQKFKTNASQQKLQNLCLVCISMIILVIFQKKHQTGGFLGKYVAHAFHGMGNLALTVL